MDLYLIKEGEISLKGGNRIIFERQLRANIRAKLKPYECHMDKTKGRVYLFVDPLCPKERVKKALNTTFGVTGWAESFKSDKKSIQSIVKKAREILSLNPFGKEGSFKIDVRREDKSFPLSSVEIAMCLADEVEKYYPNLSVNLKNPDYTLTVEVRNDCYLYTNSSKGPGGLPVSSAGRGLLLLSGGIDSPVAGVMMAKRGMKLDALYFHAYPYTSEKALEKVKSLSALIAPYLQGLRLFVVPFTKPQEYIRDHALEEEATLMFRAAMLETASLIEEKTHSQAIVTGEALSQVASQTLSAMAFTDSMTDSLVLRPLCGMDKEEIIAKAKEIGTYETSILPYEDCCVVFSPKHPITNPDKKETEEHYRALNMTSLIEDAVSNLSEYTFLSTGEEKDEKCLDK